jgi:hypothetical protein
MVNFEQVLPLLLFLTLIQVGQPLVSVGEACFDQGKPGLEPYGLSVGD